MCLSLLLLNSLLSSCIRQVYYYVYLSVSLLCQPFCRLSNYLYVCLSVIAAVELLIVFLSFCISSPFLHTCLLFRCPVLRLFQYLSLSNTIYLSNSLNICPFHYTSVFLIIYNKMIFMGELLLYCFYNCFRNKNGNFFLKQFKADFTEFQKLYICISWSQTHIGI